jgi:hypothetical protein
MSNARTLANTINSSSQIVVPSGGVQFADTTNANTVANESNLIEQDGYEEGSWSPIYQPATGAFGSYTPDLETGYYTKVGKLVTCTFLLRTDAITVGTASGNARLGGLPFTSISYQARVAHISYSSSFAGQHPAAGYASGSSDFVTLAYRTTADGSLNNNLNVTDLDTGANANYIIGSVIYYAD